MNERPGFGLERMARLARDAVERCRLDLRGAAVLTEAATGAYAITAAMAALAGADPVFAVAKSTRFGTREEAFEQTRALARQAGAAGPLRFIPEKTPEALSACDIVTNAGHVRPIDAEAIAHLCPTAAISLMYEAWELRPEDLDWAACRERGIAAAGVDERHAAVDVFAFLGPLAVRMLHESGVAVQGCRIGVLCDNPFAPHLQRGIAGGGAAAVALARTALDFLEAEPLDAIVVASGPGDEGLAIGEEEAQALARIHRGTVVAQFLGEMDREALLRNGFGVWPLAAPPRGHMGALLSDLGPEPIARLQAGGLKVGELLWRGRTRGLSDRESIEEAVMAGFATAIED